MNVSVNEVTTSSLYNEDLAPVPPSRRNWGVYNYASLWVGMSVCIPTYMLASGLIAGGMSWWQAVGTILLGNLIALVPMLLSDYSAYIFGWLVGYSGLLGPIAGIMIVDYFLLRRGTLAVEDLYLRGRSYEYTGGVNRRSLWALGLGVAVALFGLVAPPLRWLYDYAWFVGFLVAGAAHFALMQRAPVAARAPLGEET